MKLAFYLVVNSNGSVRTCKHRPALAWNEISIRQSLTLPTALFQKPHIEAQVVIPDDAASPTEITAEVQMNVKEAIEQATGLNVRLTVEAEAESA